MKEFIEFCKELATASGVIIRKYFRSDLSIEFKHDTSPVTIADREVEAKMCGMIQNTYPEHGILGEEFGVIDPGADYQWIIDPIDGTKNFLAGTCLFGTLISLMKKDEPVLGVINNPILKQFLIGDGMTTWLNGSPVRVRECDNLRDATLLTTSHRSVAQHRNGPAFEALTSQVKMYRSWGDCYGYYLVATGYADIMIDPAMHIWDVAPLIPIINGAGGRITVYYGNDPLKGEGTIATAGPLHEDVIRLLNP